jgi:hypothetical protein
MSNDQSTKRREGTHTNWIQTVATFFAIATVVIGWGIASENRLTKTIEDAETRQSDALFKVEKNLSDEIISNREKIEKDSDKIDGIDKRLLVVELLLQTSDIQPSTVLVVSAPTPIPLGDIVDVTVTVVNVSSSNIENPFTLYLVSDNNTPLDKSDDITIGSRELNGLEVGSSITERFSWNTEGANVGKHALSAHNNSNGVSISIGTVEVTIYEP